jgi:prepilin signal peptidase PulO-like enzyme (type II secretory pathway)
MIIAILIVLGLCFGSFVNALVWRLHEQETVNEKLEKANKAQAAKFRLRLKDLSISKGRSMCTSCGHTLAWYDLLPVVSWLSVRGKCRYCSNKISWQYPIVELATAGLFVASYLLWPQELTGVGLFGFIIWLPVLTAFMALTVYDLRWFILPNVIVYPLIALAASQRLADSLFYGVSYVKLFESLIAAAIGGGIFYVIFQVSKGKWIGGGDVKLGYALGLLVASPFQALLLLMIASIIGLIFSLPALFSGRIKKNLEIPFGPSLIIACIILVLFGKMIVDWYMNMLVV